MVYEADELPLAQVYHLLRHVERHVDDRDLFVLRVVSLIGEQWIINDP